MATNLATLPFFCGSGNHLNVVIQGKGWLRQVELVLSKAIHMLTQIRKQCSYRLFIKLGSLVSDNSFSSKEGPFGEPIKRLAFVRC